MSPTIVSSAIGLVVVAARLFAVVAHQAPPGIVGYLGVIPLGLGVKQLIELARTRGPTAERAYRPTPARAGAQAVALITLACSADSLATFAAIFADTRPPLGLIVLATTVGCAVVFAIGARKLVHNTGIGRQISRVAPYVMPFLLIAIGLFILADTPTDVLGLVPARW